MSYHTLLAPDLEAEQVTITLNRPERRNALTLPMVDELTEVYTRLIERPPRVLTLTGAGAAFCAGADLFDDLFHGADSADRSAKIADAMQRHFHPMVEAFYAIPCPKIAQVNGVAAGAGVSLALLADLVVAARSARFVLPFAPRLGLAPDLSATWTLPRLIGRARARGLALLGDSLDAATAVEWGLIWQATPDDELATTCAALAERLAAGPTLAFVETGRALDAALDAPLSAQLTREYEAQVRLAAQPEFIEGIAAFTSKREPRFHRDAGE